MAKSTRRKPDKQRVIESYWYEVKARGVRGAYRRTGEMYRVSDETVRRYVAQSQHPVIPDTDDLTYIPCPGEKPIAPKPQILSRMKPKRHIHSHSRMMRHYGILCRATSSHVVNTTHVVTAIRHIPEPIPDTRPWPLMPQHRQEQRTVDYRKYGIDVLTYIMQYRHIWFPIMVSILLISIAYHH